MSFAPTERPKLPGYVCDGGGICPQPKPPKGACDGGGICPRPPRIEPGDIGRTILDKVGTIGTSQDTLELSNAPKSKSKKVLGAAILLIGGAMLGYGHKDYIAKGINKVKTGLTNFFATGKPAELLQKGKEVVAKAKDVVMTKA